MPAWHRRGTDNTGQIENLPHLFDQLQLLAIPLDGFDGIDVEVNLAVGSPVAAIEAEFGTARLEIIDVGIVFHAAPLDGVEVNRDGDVSPQTAVVAIAGEGNLILKVAINQFQ